MSGFAQEEFVDAAACGDLAGVKDLLSDASLPASVINWPDKDGRSAFHYSCLNDDVPLLTILLADPRVGVNNTSPNGDTALHMAALYAALEAMKLLFADGRINVNSQNKFGETPLHLCAGSGDKSAAMSADL
jgi:ankyrin repeat protein